MPEEDRIRELTKLIDQRVKELCSKAITAEGADLDPIISELRVALAEHARFVRRMAAQALNLGSSTKAAD